MLASKGSSPVSGRRPILSVREGRLAMTLEYRERSTLGSGWALEAYSSGVLVGHIQLGASNLFRYYDGSDLTPSLSDSDLETLQRKVGDHRHPVT
jgi:hypothetical protein